MMQVAAGVKSSITENSEGNAVTEDAETAEDVVDTSVDGVFK